MVGIPAKSVTRPRPATTACPDGKTVASPRQHAPAVAQVARPRLFESWRVLRYHLCVLSPFWACADRRNDTESIWGNRAPMLDQHSEPFPTRADRRIRGDAGPCARDSVVWGSLSAHGGDRADRSGIARC